MFIVNRKYHDFGSLGEFNAFQPSRHSKSKRCDFCYRLRSQAPRLGGAPSRKGLRTEGVNSCMTSSSASLSFHALRPHKKLCVH